MISTYANAYLGNYVLFGEIGRSPMNALGGVAGAAFEKHSVQVLLQGRHYPPEFASHHGQAFGEGGGSPHNEQGVYLGLRMRVAANWRLGAYFDQFRFPWLRFNVPRPTTGKEGRFLLEYEPRPWLSSYLQFRTQSREEGTQYSVQDRRLEGVSPERRQSVRWHTEYTFSSVLTLRTRLEGSRYSSKNGSENGFLLSQGFRFRPSSSLRLDARLAFFDTDGYDSRIYAYEHDLLYSFSVPVFFERGRRSYLLVQYEPTSSVVLEAKFGVLRYANLSTVGSGLNEVASPQRREIGLQVRWNL